MSGDRLFLDTNILLYFLRGDREVIEMISDKDLIISFITELELLSFSGISPESEQVIRGLLSNCLILELTPEIKSIAVELRKKTRLKLPDAIIAATAYSIKTPLLTADKHFSKLDELDIIIYDT